MCMLFELAKCKHVPFAMIGLVLQVKNVTVTIVLDTYNIHVYLTHGYIFCTYIILQDEVHLITSSVTPPGEYLVCYCSCTGLLFIGRDYSYDLLQCWQCIQSSGEVPSHVDCAPASSCVPIITHVQKQNRLLHATYNYYMHA